MAISAASTRATATRRTRGRTARRGERRRQDIGHFVDGRLDGKGVYTWENGARLEGTFKADKAEGPGVYVSSSGVRYEGPFHNGKLVATKREDCPQTPGPLEC
jgi:hypothetical protein